MVIAEVTDVQQVTTRSKGKTTQWETQRTIRQQTTKGTQKADERNLAEVRELIKPPRGLIETIDEDLTWQALQECQIMLPLGSLLQLVPRFTEGLKSMIAPQNVKPTMTFFSNPEEGLAVVDRSSPTITAIVRGREVPGTAVDGGSNVNVINQDLCDILGIQNWEPCPFWLRMADTSLVCPTTLSGIWKLQSASTCSGYHGSLVAQRPRGLPLAARMTMAADGTHKAKFAEERLYIPERKDKNMGINTTTRGY